jgi:hypothetical protein
VIFVVTLALLLTGGGVWPVVGAVQHDCVVSDTQLVELIQQRPDRAIVVDHHIVVFRLPAP